MSLKIGAPKGSRRQFLFALPFLPSAIRVAAQTHAKALDFESMRSRLSKIKSIKISHVSSGRNPKTVIVMKDYHGGNDSGFGWKVNYRAIEEIRRQVPIDAIGIEGWAGHDADKRRGYVLMTAEKSLTEKLHRGKIPVIGLEDRQLHEIVIKEKLWNIYITNKETEKLVRNIESQSEERIKAISTKSNISKRQKKNMKTTERAKVNAVLKNLEHDKQAFYDLAKQLNIPVPPPDFVMNLIRDQLKSYYGEIYENLSQSNSWYLKHHNRITIVERSKVAANKILSDMENNGHSTTLMVFGANHLQSIIEELQRHGVNIITITIPKEEEAFQKSRTRTIQEMFKRNN